MKRMQVDNVKLIEEFNVLNHENKKIKDHHKLIEIFMETVLGAENFEKMLMSIDNDAIMGRSVKSIQKKTHRRRSSHHMKVPNIDGEKIFEQITKDGAKTSRDILREFEKNRQNIIDQNKIMDDIQKKMDTFGREFNIKKEAGSALELETNHYTPHSYNTVVPNTNHLTNFIPKSGRSSEIRAHARAESEQFDTATTPQTKLDSQRDLNTKRSLPIIHEK